MLQFLPLPGDVLTFREDGTGARFVALPNRRFDVSGRAGRPSQRRDRPGERYRRETLKRSPLVLAIRSSASSVSARSRGETFTPRALTGVALSWKHGKMVTVAFWRKRDNRARLGLRFYVSRGVGFKPGLVAPAVVTTCRRTKDGVGTPTSLPATGNKAQDWA